MNIINPFLIKESFSKYTDSSSFSNYQKIAKEYYKLFNKLQKRINNIQNDQLRSKVKQWFFNLSLESRIKICTVENELFSDFIFQMYLRTKHDKSIEFIPKNDLFEIYDLTKSQNIYKDFMGEAPLIEFSLDNYFQSRSDIYSSYAEKYNMMEDGLYEPDENDKKYNSNIFEFINNDIKFYSVHHKPFPDCFCFSPYFLLNEERFDSTFNFFGNINYFKKLIQPFFNLEKNIYGYFLPEWFNELNNNNSNYSVTKYIFAFIEQAILVKYILNNYFINKKPGNKNCKNDLIFSLINEENLNSIFTDRKTVINYFNMNYNDANSKKKLLDETNISNIFENIIRDNEINGKMVVYNHINYYIYNPLYDDIRLFLNTNQNERNNYVVNKIKNNIIKAIELSDNIIFTDFLLYQNAHNLWEYEYFINYKIIEYFINLFNEKNYNDLLEEEKETNTKKKKKRKKKKNQKAKDNEININNNNDNINNNINNNIGNNIGNNKEEVIQNIEDNNNLIEKLEEKIKEKENNLKNEQKDAIKSESNIMHDEQLVNPNQSLDQSSFINQSSIINQSAILAEQYVLISRDPDAPFSIENTLKFDKTQCLGILDFLNFKEKIFFTGITRGFNIERIYLLNNKREEMIRSLELKPRETVEDLIIEIRLKNSNVELSKNFVEFQVARGGAKAVELLNNDLYSKLFKKPILEKNSEEICIVYRVLFTLFGEYDIATIYGDQLFWIKCTEYLIKNSNGKIGTFILDKFKDITFEHQKIFLLNKLLVGMKKKINPNYFSKICGTTGLLIFLIKDTLEYCGVIINDKKTQPARILDNLLYYKNTIDTLAQYIDYLSGIKTYKVREKKDKDNEK